MKKRGKTLTMEQINKVKKLLRSSKEYDFYFITENNVLYGAHKIETLTEKPKRTVLTIISNCDKVV